MERKLYYYLSLTISVLLSHLCHSVSAQELKGIPDHGNAIEVNYRDFPSREKIAPEAWSKLNSGNASKTEKYYKYFGDGSTKYIAIASKQNALESYYVKADDPAVYRLMRGSHPINFLRNGEWMPIDGQLRPMGNGIYEAPDQWDPVGINVNTKESYIITPSGKIQFNDWVLYGEDANGKVVLVKADWSNYTIGADGVRIIDIFPGIDAELNVRRGGVKTSFIVHRLNYTQYRKLYFEDSFKGVSKEVLSSAVNISPAFGFPKGNPSSVTEFAYSVSGNKLSIEVPVQYLTDNLLSGDVIIDPLVQSTNSIDQSLVGTMYNASCGMAGSCNYTIPVTPPATTTITGVFIEIYMLATAPCGRENAAYQLYTGTCISPGPGSLWFVGGGATGPGPIFGFRNRADLMPCMPAPACTYTPIDFTFRLFRSCVGPTGCDNTCIGLIRPLAVIIQGRTAELNVITPNPAIACFGQNIDFATSGVYGVPPYSAINWSLNASGIPSLGTGNTISAGAALAPGNHTIYASTTDACGSIARANRPFIIRPRPLASSPDKRICNGAPTNITPISNLGGTTYTWTVVQTGVTGASDGSGTSIVQRLNNYGNAPGTAVYTVTPTANGCTGSPFTVTVTVDPVSKVLYVDDINGNDTNCGNAWTSALKTVSWALRLSELSTNVDSILVAKGTYYPTGTQNSANRDSSFHISDDRLKIYGGYPNGGGTRDIASNPTILSGDIGTANDTIDNSYHVVFISRNAGTDSIVVDGFTITKGNADGAGSFSYDIGASPQANGGGVFIRDNGTTIVLRNLVIKENTARISGGGMHILLASPTIENCAFINNHSLNRAGAVANEDAPSPGFTGCSFTGNAANITGGAVFNQNVNSQPSFMNCSFTDNSAGTPTVSGWGGAMYNYNGANATANYCTFTGNSATSGGGAVIGDLASYASFSHSIFTNNRALSGTGTIGTGGALQTGGNSTQGMILVNCVLINNIAGGTNDDGGGAIMLYGGAITSQNTTFLDNTTRSTTRPNANTLSINGPATAILRNSILWGAAAQQVHRIGGFNFTYSLVKGTATALPNLDVDPLFVDAINPAGPDGIWRTADDGLQLSPCSPAVNMGNNIFVLTTTDMTSGPRIANATADMGAYELQVPNPTINFTDVIKTYGDPDAAVPNVTNCSGLPMTFTIADNTIADIVGGNLHIIKAGTTTITAHTINGAPDVTVNLIINPKPITVSLTALPIVKVYDGNTNATISTANLQLAAGDVVGADDVALAVSGNGVYDTKDAGTGKTVTVPLANISLTGTTASNYVIANTTDLAGPIGVIIRLSIYVIPDALTKVYGDADPVLSYTYSPALIGSDVFTGALIRVPGEDVGVYPLAIGTLALDNNYTLFFNGGNLTITPKPVTVTADPKTKVYGDADPVLTYTVAPALIAGDAFTGSLIRTADENVGLYPINQGTLALNGNYTITYTGDNLTITPKAITITAQPKTKIYGNADPALTYTYFPALVAGDAFTGGLIRVTGENVGVYAINQGTLALNGNYAVAYTGADLTIMPKAITITAQPGAKVYGDADPVLTYTYSPALVAGDAFTGSLIRTAGENAGVYPINQGTLALSNNYQTTYLSASFVITRAVLIVTAEDISICFGDVLTTGSVAYTGFRNGDNPSSLNTQPIVNMPAIPSAGSYTITPSGGVSDNYDFTYVSGQLTVRPSPSGIITQILIGPGVINTPGVTGGEQLTAPVGTGYTYLWNTGETAPSIFVQLSGNYYVDVTSPQGCTRRFAVQVRQRTIIIPNIFSPNGDGIHDKWVIENLENYPGNVVQIYNRYGQAVHKIVNYTPWDGRISGKDMPIGTYYYIIDPKNGQKPITGFIDIIR